MIAWSRRRTLLAGIALILAVNAVALAGVAYNRSGEPDSVLRLTERELQASYGWHGSAENSGAALTLRWRVPVEESADSRGPVYFGGIGGSRWIAPLLPSDFRVPNDFRWPEYISTARGTEWWIPTRSGDPQ